MPLEDLHGSRRALNYSPSRSTSCSRLYGPMPSQRHQRPVPPAKKPPEPLRWAVADCLSAAASNLQASSCAPSSEAPRTLRDYFANPSTRDMAYSVLVEHALAERDRSPAVVPRCVALLKRYLLRYIPKVQTLQQIDHFCETSIIECDSIPNPRVSLWSKSLSQQHRASSVTSNTLSPSVHASNFASPSLVKSLSYVRSLVAHHIPKLSFQPSGQSRGSASTKQSLPTLSSLLSRSVASHLSPEVVSSRESPQKKEGPGHSAFNLSSLDKVDNGDSNRSISVDLLTWRWSVESSFFTRESDGFMRPQDVRSYGFLEVGAAALLIGDMEAKAKDQSWKYAGNQDLPDIDQLFQLSTATMASNYASSHNHLKAITAAKRLKSDPQQIWTNVPTSTYHPRARPLFQYRHYSEQQPLRLNPAEISEVIAEVCSDSSLSNVNLPTESSPLTNLSRRPPTDVAVSVLVKLVIDMYMMDSGIAAPLALSMLEDILSSKKVASRVRAFDLILNLGVHAHLLEPVLHEDSLTIHEEEEVSQEPGLNNAEQPMTPTKINPDSTMQQRMASAINKFESWLLVILFEILWFLVQTEEQEEIVWASALSCLFYFVCDGGKILRTRLDGLDIRVIKSLLETSRKQSWAGIVRCRLICMLTNMFYQAPNKSTESIPDNPIFLVEQVDLLGGIDFICLEYSQANSREEKRNLFLVLFDYVLHQINEACFASGVSAYTYEEAQLVASMLSLADAPEAFYIAVKHGVEGIGEILRKPISSAMSRSPNYKRLDLLLDKVTRKLDATISIFTCLDKEFSYMIQITKSYRSCISVEEGLGETDGMNVSLSWATLHSLLHSDRYAYHHNGYIWLTELLLSEISEASDRSIWRSIKDLQEQIGVAGSQDLASPSVPLSISLLCGLLKSKHNYIRWGFLFVLDKLLMRLKLLLDESDLQNRSHGDAVSFDHSENRLEKANAVVDIMSCALLLVVQINETDRINILKMCDILFSQLCLRLHSPNGMALGNIKSHSNRFGTIESYKRDSVAHVPETLQDKKNIFRDELSGKASSNIGIDSSSLICETASMAALLLRGHATVPMQLVARVPASLFDWPLIQLAGAATDDIASDVAVGSKGGGNLPGATSDIRAALLLLLIGKCSAVPTAYLEVEGEEFFRGLLDDTDSRVAYYSSAFLLKRMMTEQPENYQRMLQSLIVKAQQSNNEKLLENPYLQMRGILKLLNDPGA